MQARKLHNLISENIGRLRSRLAGLQRGNALDQRFAFNVGNGSCPRDRDCPRVGFYWAGSAEVLREWEMQGSNSGISILRGKVKNDRLKRAGVSSALKGWGVRKSFSVVPLIAALIITLSLEVV